MDSSRYFTLLKRHPAADREAFLQAWRGAGGPSLRCVVEQSPSGQFPAPEFDGIEISAGVPAYAAAVRGNLDLGRSTRVAATRHAIFDRGGGAAKFMSLLRRKPGTTPEQFSEYWRTRHAGLVQREVNVSRYFRRYVQNHCIPGSGANLEGTGTGRPVDGIVEIWFESLDELLQAMFSNAYLGALREDEGRFVDLPNARMLVVEEGGPGAPGER